MIEKTAQETIERMAYTLSVVLTSKDVDEGIKTAIDAILFETASESNTHITDAEIIRTSFPLIMERLELEYSRGIFHSLKSILEHNFDEPRAKFRNKELAELLSKVLNHPNLSNELKITIGNAITDIGNRSKSLNAFQDSPIVIYEYLFGDSYD